MPHLDPELLALLALGEDAAGPDELAHLRGCAVCTADLAGLRRPVELARAAALDEPPERPDDRVWRGIAADLGIAGAGPVPLPAPPARRSRGALVAALAAAAVLVVAGVGIGVVVARSTTATLATATLRAFPDWPGERGTAVLSRRADGERVVELRTTVAPASDTDHEVWLMTANARRLVSLGVLHGTDGTFAVPAGVDLSRYDLVDVSDEPRDGDPAHSGDSIIRGALHS